MILPDPSSPFEQVRVDLAGKLQAAGLDVATIDPGAGVPFVLVGLIALTPPSSGVGAWAGRVPVSIVAAPPGNLAAGRWLEQTLTTVLATLGWAPATPTRYQLDDTHDAPAYELTYPVDVPNPDC